MPATILIVDDDPVQRRLLESMVRRFGYEAVAVDGGDAALGRLLGPDAPATDAVVLDIVMPDLDGLGVLARLKAAGSTVPVIVQTAHGGIDNVISAMRAGAADFVVKPVGPERLQVSLRNALAAHALEGELKRLERSRSGTLTFRDVITRSPRMQAALRTARKAAGSDIPVLAVVLAEGDEVGICEFPPLGGQPSRPRDAVAATSVPLDPQPPAHPGAVPRHGDPVHLCPELSPDFAQRALPILDRNGDIRPLAEVESELIRVAISHYEGRMSEVARRLRIGRSTLYRRLKELGVEADAVTEISSDAVAMG